jgi:DNA-binding CsgD family transcriptional regulator
MKCASLHARSLAAIGRGDFEQAFRLAAAVSPPGKFAAHVGEALFVCMNLVEAAVHTNRLAEANAHVAAMREEGIAALSPRLALVVAGSTAVTRSGGAATELFEQALAIPNTDRWPFDRARVQLAYGEHLRRTNATSCSRIQLSEALEQFERLGARPWATRASNELRATGQVRSACGHRKTAALTPQEQAIAALAASGPSNKQIAERFYLSHRTVENHLHRLFPKLGVTSRAGLRDALTPDGSHPMVLRSHTPTGPISSASCSPRAYSLGSARKFEHD